MGLEKRARVDAGRPVVLRRSEVVTAAYSVDPTMLASCCPDTKGHAAAGKAPAVWLLNIGVNSLRETQTRLHQHSAWRSA